MSTDGELRPRRSPSTSSHEKTRCPSCGQRQLTTVIVDGELPVSICGGCGRGYEVDQSTDAESTTLLLVDEDFECRQCRNDDLDRFDVVESPHPDRLRVRCVACSGVVDVRLKDWRNDGAGSDARDAWVAEVLSSGKARDEADSGSSWDDGDSGYVVDSKDDRDIGGRKDVGVDARNRCRRNNEVDCFRRCFDAASGNLSTVTCRCHQKKAVKSFFGVECWHCGNNSKQRFERHFDDYGRITRLRCLECGKRLHLPGQPSPRKEAGPEKLPHPSGPVSLPERQTAKDASGVGLDWTKIEDLRHIRRGDHVARYKWYGVWHHAIVVDVPDGGRALTVIHYNGGMPKLDGHFASVRLETIEVDPEKEDVYRIDYPDGDTDPVEKVVERACDRLGEAKYNPFTNNCEHLARWCKTGRAECGQVRKFRLACQNAILGQVLIPVPLLGGFIGCKYKIGKRIGLAAIKR